MTAAPAPTRPAGWMERIGAALVAPTRALAASETESGSGRAPADLGFLILVGFAAAHLPLLVKAGWLVADGSAMDGLRLVLNQLSWVLMPLLVFVVVAGIATTLLAGTRRSIANDFDLACVAAVPLGAIPPLVELADRLGASAPTVKFAGFWLANGWGGALVVLAVWQARRRPPRERRT